MARFYEKPITRYTFPAKDFTSSDTTYVITGPKGKVGYLHDFGVYGVSVTFAGATTRPAMKVGLVGTLDAYGKSQTFPTTLTAAIGSQSVRQSYDEANDNASFIALIPVKNTPIPADTPVNVTLVAATGGSGAGTGIPFVDIRWDD